MKSPVVQMQIHKPKSIDWLVSIRRKIPLKEIFKKNRITKFPWHRNKPEKLKANEIIYYNLQRHTQNLDKRLRWSSE